MQQPTRLISTPFAQEGDKTEIQNVTGEFDNSATYRLGFPPLTMQSIRSGGKPPKGTDFNGVLFDITENISFLCKGGRYQYNAGLSTLIGGYPEGSNLLLDDNVTEVVSTVAGNQNNPNTDMTGWILKPIKAAASDILDESGKTQQTINDEQQLINISNINALNDRYTKEEIDLQSDELENQINSVNSTLSASISTKADITYVDAQLSAVAGGHKGFATLALAQASQSSLTSGTIVEVTNDGANNGTYQWNGTTLTKSSYDPLTQAKSYTDNKVKDEISKSLSGNASKAENQFIYSLDGTTLRLEWNTSFFWSDIAAKEGDWYLITAKSTGDIVKSYYTANGSNVLSSGGIVSNQVFVQIPIGANRLVVNCLISERDSFSVKLLSSGEVKLFEKLTPPPLKVRDAFPQKNSYTGLLKQKCPKFFNKLHNKTGDLVVVMSGTSLTQGNLYTSNRTDASSRPPLLHTNDLASHIFDTLKGFWHGQKYLRYDHPNVRYYEDTEWVVSNDIKVGGVSIWDDRAEFKNGLTKTSVSPNARVSAVVPVGAWQFNFIYRSDSQGANCVIDIYEGNGKIEVFNGTNWVEANRYSFSMRESAKTNRKGNTCYQKRLKMRCKNKAVGGVDSLNTVKNITISKGADSDRFNVVGFEWSPREFMFTLINGARGSHNWGSGTTHNLENYQDTDIWEFKPDLILCEATTINWGGGWGYNLDPNLYVNYAKRSYYDEFSDNPLALKNTSGNFENCEVIFYGDTLSTHGGATQSWNSDKTPKFGIVTTVADNGDGSTENLGRSKTVFENYEAVETYMQSKPNIFVPVFYQFKELAERFYGNYPDAFVGSWTSGATLAFDTVHLNDNGAAFWAHLITPLFENL